MVYAGDWSRLGGYSGDGVYATSAELAHPFGVAVDNAGDIYISDQNNNRIRKVDHSGVITTLGQRRHRQWREQPGRPGRGQCRQPLHRRHGEPVHP